MPVAALHDTGLRGLGVSMICFPLKVSTAIKIAIETGFN
ncbi:hypothetical protein CKA32_001612 [Geitlerinema sp. FC II]|nr:hypothetical protein CKA32_001612 [Geitlerinema sp. FC II]